MYHKVEYSDNYSKTLWYLRQYYRDETADATVGSKSFKIQHKIRGKTLLIVIQWMLK